MTNIDESFCHNAKPNALENIIISSNDNCNQAHTFDKTTSVQVIDYINQLGIFANNMNDADECASGIFFQALNRIWKCSNCRGVGCAIRIHSNFKQIRARQRYKRQSQILSIPLRFPLYAIEKERPQINCYHRLASIFNMIMCMQIVCDWFDICIKPLHFDFYIHTSSFFKHVNLFFKPIKTLFTSIDFRIHILEHTDVLHFGYFLLLRQGK